MSDDLLTPQEVARLLRLHYSCVRRWILQGKLSHTKKGRRLFVLRADLDAFLAKRGAKS